MSSLLARLARLARMITHHLAGAIVVLVLLGAAAGVSQRVA